LQGEIFTLKRRHKLKNDKPAGFRFPADSAIFSFIPFCKSVALADRRGYLPHLPQKVRGTVMFPSDKNAL